MWSVSDFELLYSVKSLFQNCYCRAFWEYFPKICSIGFFYESGNIRFFNVKKRKWTSQFRLNNEFFNFSLVKFKIRKDILVTLVNGDRVMLWNITMKGIKLVKCLNIEDLSGGLVTVKGGKFLIGSDCMGKICAVDIITGESVTEVDLDL